MFSENNDKTMLENFKNSFLLFKNKKLFLNQMTK